MNEVSSFKEMIERVVRSSFQNALEAELAVLEKEVLHKVKTMFDEKKTEAKKMANSMALELLQKSNINGISLELKI